MRIKTICEQEIFVAHFGINENGDQPICNQTIEIDNITQEELETDEAGLHYFTTNCPKCGTELCWPHTWDIVT
jgi:hypothetical protein